MRHMIINGGTVAIGEHVLPVDVRVNPKARRLILRLGRERRITVTCPTKRHVSQALKMVETQRDWLLSQLSQAPAPIPLAIGEVLPVLGENRLVVAADSPTAAARLTGHRILVGGRDEESIHRRIECLLKRTVRTEILAEIGPMADRLEVTIKRITVRQMTSRWGSCAADGALAFNWRLVFAPRHVLHYVIAHEVAHRREMNHSEAFWAQVAHLYPEYKLAENWLRQHGDQLHAFGQRPALHTDTKKAA